MLIYKTLTVLSKIDDFFTEIFSGLGKNFSWSSVVVLLTGILIGFVLSLAIYLIIFVASIKAEKKKIDENRIKDEDALKEDLVEKVSEIKTNFLNDSTGLSTKEKSQMLGTTIYQTVNVIASTYYPESKYPIYELSVDELIVLLKYLSTRLDEVFSKNILKLFRKMTVTQVFNFIDAKKKVEDNKIVKATIKAKPHKIISTITATLNYANPIYWFKRIFTNTVVNFTINKIFILVIDIVADETSKAYSKSIYNEEININRMEIDQAIAEMENENQ